jgi:hypothetical protein
VLVELDGELSEEARGADRHQRWRVPVLPEHAGERCEEVIRKVVRDDKRKAGNPRAALRVREHAPDVARVRDAVYAVVELAEEADSLLRAVLPDARGTREEEVVARIRG